MSIITVSRQLASLGSDVAQAVAELLGYRLVRREVILEAARRAGAPEVALAAIDELGLLKMCPSPQACHAYHRAVKQVMEEMAAEGNIVIIGRAGHMVLHGHPDLLRVRVVSPKPVRVERLARRYNILPEAALAQIEASDHYRRNYLKRFYHALWDDPALFDLVVNTEHTSPEIAARSIAAMSVHPSRSPRKDEPISQIA